MRYWQAVIRYDVTRFPEGDQSSAAKGEWVYFGYPQNSWQGARLLEMEAQKRSNVVETKVVERDLT